MTLKTATVPDWTQAQLNAAIAGNPPAIPAGTLLSGFILPSDWNQIQPALDAKLNLTGGTVSGNIDMDGNTIDNVGLLRNYSIQFEPYNGVLEENYNGYLSYHPQQDTDPFIGVVSYADPGNFALLGYRGGSGALLQYGYNFSALRIEQNGGGLGDLIASTVFMDTIGSATLGTITLNASFFDCNGTTVNNIGDTTWYPNSIISAQAVYGMTITSDVPTNGIGALQVGTTVGSAGYPLLSTIDMNGVFMGGFDDYGQLYVGSDGGTSKIYMQDSFAGYPKEVFGMTDGFITLGNGGGISWFDMYQAQLILGTGGIQDGTGVSNPLTKALVGTGSDTTFNITPTLVGYKNGLNAKTVANTSLFTSVVGRELVITGIAISAASATGITVGATMGFGISAGTNDVVASSVVAVTATTNMTYLTPINGAKVLQGSNQLYCNLSVAATGTAMSLNIWVFGFYK